MKNIDWEALTSAIVVGIIIVTVAAVMTFGIFYGLLCVYGG